MVSRATDLVPRAGSLCRHILFLTYVHRIGARLFAHNRLQPYEAVRLEVELFYF